MRWGYPRPVRIGCHAVSCGVLWYGVLWFRVLSFGGSRGRLFWAGTAGTRRTRRFGVARLVTVRFARLSGLTRMALRRRGRRLVRSVCGSERLGGHLGAHDNRPKGRAGTVLSGLTLRDRHDAGKQRPRDHRANDDEPATPLCGVCPHDAPQVSPRVVSPRARGGQTGLGATRYDRDLCRSGATFLRLISGSGGFTADALPGSPPPRTGRTASRSRGPARSSRPPRRAVPAG